MTKAPLLNNPEYRDQVKYNVYQAYHRGMSKQELSRAFGHSPAIIEQLINEAALESVRERSDREMATKQAILLDEIREDIATLYNQISKIEEGQTADQKPKEVGAEKIKAFASLMNTLRAYRELVARIEGHLVNKIAGPDGEAIQITAIADRSEAEKQVIELLQQANRLNGNNKTITISGEIDYEADKVH